MKMYVANCTGQAQMFIYRLPETMQMRQQRIEVGSQIVLSGDLGLKDVEYIVKQHEKYGMVKDEAVKNVRTYVGLAYSVDRPVALGNLRHALQLNREVLVERGKQQRQNAAVAVNAAVEAATQGGPVPQAMEFTVQEDPKRTGSGAPLAPRSDEGNEPLNEGIRVSRNEDPSPKPSPARPRRTGKH